MAAITLSGVGKRYPDGTRAVDGLDLTVAEGEFLVLVGPSGCGKSTALRMIAGLETISEGELRIDDRLVNALTPQQRNIAMVFQNYALYPHMSVGKNLRFPLRMRRMSRAAIERKVDEIARVLGLEALLDRRPKQLSGGQRQRVAMGRALVRDPAAFLMDEPLSNLDAKLRVQMRAEIGEIQRRTGTTTIYVTHDQVEAMTMGQRVAVLHEGRLQQCAAPQELYERPVNAFVASFIGSPSMNLFHAPVAGHELLIGEQRIALPEALRVQLPALSGAEQLLFGLRPESFTLADDATPDTRIAIRVESVEPLGHEQIVHARLPLTGRNHFLTPVGH